MNLNTLGLVLYDVGMMYIFVYWILWFFKAPYYKRMAIHKNVVLQCAATVFVLWVGAAVGLEQAIIHIKGEESPAFGFWAVLMIAGGTCLFMLPDWITTARNKIPNRWEN